MQRLRITHTDGVAWTRALDVSPLSIGRADHNHVVLRDPAVSYEHCSLEFVGDQCVVKDRGSANGTYVDNQRLDEPRVLREGDRLYIGPFLLELVSLVAEAPRRARAPLRAGPILRETTAKELTQRELSRLSRWSVEWDHHGRPPHLLLRGGALRQAAGLLRAAPDAATPLVLAFVDASRRGRSRSRVGLALVLLVALVVTTGTAVAFGLLGGDDAADADDTTIAQSTAPEAPTAVAVPLGDVVDAAPPRVENWVEHSVIPAESLDEIAARYDVSRENLARWNRLNPDDPVPAVGTVLRIDARRSPLPQQQISYELDKDYDWRQLSEHFGVPVAKLRAYNTTLGTELPTGTVVDIWIDPKPYDKRRSSVQIPEFAVRPDALSVGRPNEGRVDNGIQMPESPLYLRRAPNIMWGTSATIQSLLTAVARFRQDIEFDGVLVLADISKRGGGHLPPHKSHQAGRDIDIWMPTLRGVYKKSYLGKERKPRPSEIDWFATWALIRALVEGGNVAHIFLEYELQEKVYRAAKLMGATEEELTASIQWPRGKFASGTVAHSSGHTGHIHVRFRCAPAEPQCVDGIRREGEDEHGD